MFPRVNFFVILGVVCLLVFVQILLYTKTGKSKIATQIKAERGKSIVNYKYTIEDAKRDARGREFGRLRIPAQRVRAAIVILARNTDINGLKQSISMLEDTFNKRFHYPYVFLNDAEFTEEFKTEMKKLSTSAMKFGRVPKEHWSYPSWIDQSKAKSAREEMEHNNVIYGGSESYRHMCRFNSGFFFRHPLLDEYEYYWRVEPDVKFFCQVEYDPFMFMKRNNIKYGWVITLPEYPNTIPTLWETTKKFMETHPETITKENTLEIIVNDDGEYNGCHYWSNFEIGSLDFFRSERYLKYFDYLDKAGGFFYERWGDAPVHSIAIAMFLPKHQIHYFDDIGYYHGPFTNCPIMPSMADKCTCKPSDTIPHSDHCFQKFVTSKDYHEEL